MSVKAGGIVGYKSNTYNIIARLHLLALWDSHNYHIQRSGAKENEQAAQKTHVEPALIYMYAYFSECIWCVHALVGCS